MLKVVIDTSSLVSYVLTRGDIMRRVIAAWREDQFILLSSAETRAELAAVVARPKIKILAAAPLDELVKGIERFTRPVYGELDLSGACRDSKDDKFLACAVMGEADIWSAAIGICWT
jgi:putative PIN family toxin of toxin-antitoxin system